MLKRNLHEIAVEQLRGLMLQLLATLLLLLMVMPMQQGAAALQMPLHAGAWEQRQMLEGRRKGTHSSS